MAVAIDCVAPLGAVLGEGPVWDPRGGTLYWVDIKRPALHALDWPSRARRAWPMPQRIGAIGLREHGGLIGAFKNGFASIDLATGAVTPLVDPEPNLPGNRFNDGKVDRAGRFWAGSMDDDERRPTGHLYRLDSDCTATRFEAGFVVTNGIEWSGDGRTLYVVDTMPGLIYAYDFDMAAGCPGARRVFARVRRPTAIPTA